MTVHDEMTMLMEPDSLIAQCTAPLGMESGAIPDDDITASSSFDSGNVGPQFGRLRGESHGGAWCPKYQITTEPKEWLEVDLHGVHVITAVETQGRFGNGQGQEFAEAYLLEYWRPRLGKWVRFRNIKGEEVYESTSIMFHIWHTTAVPPLALVHRSRVPRDYWTTTMAPDINKVGRRRGSLAILYPSLEPVISSALDLGSELLALVSLLEI
ncbi:DNA damage responsive protein [Homalodisca vitripennis]|nr:DNA damage responsive protein [Homalodisca vitripennis]